MAEALARAVEPNIDALRQAAASCRACDLWANATQTVFGEGGSDARMMLVGEQPGDREDRDRRPFVGPAGRVLDEALALAGIDRSTVYVTNAVKHFKWVPRGKRRLHQKPNTGEIRACRPWLEAEAVAIKPDLVVCLGATAARAVLGPGFKVTQRRGEVLPSLLGRPALATVHPASIARIQVPVERDAAMEALVADLSGAAQVLRGR